MYILSILVTGVVVAGPVAAVGVVALVRARRAPRSPGTVRTAGVLFLAAALLQAVSALLPPVLIASGLPPDRYLLINGIAPTALDVLDALLVCGAVVLLIVALMRARSGPARGPRYPGAPGRQPHPGSRGRPSPGHAAPGRAASAGYGPQPVYGAPGPDVPGPDRGVPYGDPGTDTGGSGGSGGSGWGGGSGGSGWGGGDGGGDGGGGGGM